MLFISNIRTVFWNIDPGYFNLKQALKTVLAILLSLWVVEDDALITQLLAGIGSGIAAQGIVFQTFRLRLLHVLVFSLLYVTVFSLGLVVRGSSLATALTLISLGFFVNYIRRFELEKSLAPIMVWVLCFLATILPFQSTFEVWSHFYGLLIGVGVAALVSLFVFPQNYPRMFKKNSNLFFQSLSNGLDEMRRVVNRENTASSIVSIDNVKIELIKLADSNQAMQHNPVFLKQEAQLSHLISHQYAIINAYTLLLDAVHGLKNHRIQLPRSSIIPLNNLFKAFVYILETLQVNNHFQINQQKKSVTSFNLNQFLGYVPSKDAETIIVLLNFKLGFSLLNQHIRNSDEA